ncbi:MAG: hypothetical protein A3B78_00450 [Omnitrophica WOR_2 bacterium RIFCSPHIGHO2_02_FULL_67_20]|nr:MAG: hypothetical protein A3B78_00450 [Omnitrophica WOR_2 bacterium RIFCSPHIGHO2_02_FULL_67_20]
MVVNEAFGWLWIVLGFASGTLLGLKFQSESWLGGYGSHRRRLIRLGHISFLGLGFLNILFAHSLPQLRLSQAWLSLASWSLMLGGVTMPVCCGLMAWRKNLQPIFAIPVVALLIGAFLVLIGMVQP